MMRPSPLPTARPLARVARMLPTCLLIAAACGGSADVGPTNPPGTGNPDPTRVTIQGIAFNPSTVQVSPGATVSFTNNDGFDHNVTFTSTAVSSIPNFSTGTKSVEMPAATGSYPYHCTIHPNMTGTVTVQ
jgi:plastocyanin